MNSEYHTNSARSQSRATPATPRRSLCCRPALIPSRRRVRIAVPALPAHPLLAGDPARLRELRAAEMAAWEAAFPKTQPAADSAPTGPEQRSKRFLKLGVLTMLLLGACGSVAVSLDIQDFSLLLTAWSQLVGGVRSLFA